MYLFTHQELDIESGGDFVLLYHCSSTRRGACQDRISFAWGKSSPADNFPLKRRQVAIVVLN